MVIISDALLLLETIAGRPFGLVLDCEILICGRLQVVITLSLSCHITLRSAAKCTRSGHLVRLHALVMPIFEYTQAYR